MVDRFAFLPPKSSYGHSDFPGALAWLPRFTPGAKRIVPLTVDNCIPSVFLQYGNAKYLVVVLHANAEDLGYTFQQLQMLRTHLQCHVLALEYAGYGLCSGTPGFTQIISDCHHALRFVWKILEIPKARTIILGRSIGAAIGMELANRNPGIHGFVSVGAFTSIYELVREWFGTVPALVFSGSFSNLDRVRGLRCRVLFIHGTEDALIPHSHAEKLFEECAASEKYLHLSPEMTHNVFSVSEEICNPIIQHLRVLQPAAPIFYVLPKDLFEPMIVDVDDRGNSPELSQCGSTAHAPTNL